MNNINVIKTILYTRLIQLIYIQQKTSILRIQYDTSLPDDNFGGVVGVLYTE